MAGSLSSLGLGSGTLTGDVIDGLKAADKSIMVDPIDRKIEENKGKKADISTLTTLLAGAKASASTLSSDDNYLQRDTSVVGSSVLATAAAGVAIQDIEIDVQKLAKQSVFESSGTFAGLDSNIVANGTDSTFDFNIGSSTKSVELGDGAISLSKLIEEINSQYGDEVTASALNVGNGEYKFILKSDETGADNQIWFGESINSQTLDFTNPITVATDDFSINGNDSILTSDIVAEDINDLVSKLNSAISEDSSLNVYFLADGNQVKAVSTDGNMVDLKSSAVFGGAGNLTETVDTTDPDTTAYYYKDADRGDLAVKDTFDYHTNATYDKLEVLKAYDNSDSLSGKLQVYEKLDGTFMLQEYSWDGSSYTQEGANQTFATKDELKSYIDTSLIVTDGKSSFFDYSDYSDTTIASSSGANSVNDNLELNQLTKAQNAEFTYSGVQITRDSNVVNDLTVGLNIQLQDTGNSTIKVDRDDEGFKESVKEFVASYNQVLNKLNELTDYNEETGESGSLQGVSEVTRIKSNLNRIILTSDFTQDIHSMVELGIELNDSGLLTFDESKFNEKLTEDPEAVEKFLKGFTSTVRGEDVEFDGVFTKMNKELDSLIGDNGALTLFEQNLTSTKSKLEEERERAIERLDIRYEIMANKFAAYDSMISQMNNSFNGLKMQIDMAIADKS